MAADVDFSEVTEGNLCGDGVFDELMRSIKAHLLEEYNSQRIRGSEYTQVYLGALQTSMQQAIQWHLGHEIAKNQALLIEAQIVGQEKQNLLLDEQRLKLIEDTNLVKEQILLTREQTSLVTQQILNAVEQGKLLVKQGQELDARINLLIEQVTAAAYNNTEILPLNKEKLQAEIDFLKQKKISEEAQTQDIIGPSSAPIGGVANAQITLYNKQTDGFDRDAEQKASRIVGDLWGVAVASDLEEGQIPTELKQAPMDTLIGNLKNKSGVNS